MNPQEQQENDQPQNQEEQHSANTNLSQQTKTSHRKFLNLKEKRIYAIVSIFIFLLNIIFFILGSIPRCSGVDSNFQCECPFEYRSVEFTSNGRTLSCPHSTFMVVVGTIAMICFILNIILIPLKNSHTERLAMFFWASACIGALAGAVSIADQSLISGSQDANCSYSQTQTCNYGFFIAHAVVLLVSSAIYGLIGVIIYNKKRERPQINLKQGNAN